MIGGKIKTFEEFENKLIGLYTALGKVKTTDPLWETFHTHLTSLQTNKDYKKFNEEFDAKYPYDMFKSK